jgi:hypothetical protein
MVIANTADGKTTRFDLAQEDAYAALQELLETGQVTALSILHEGTQHSLPRPRRFRKRPVYGAEQLRNGSREVLGERIFAQAEDVRVSISTTFASRLVRTDLVRLGAMQYNASARRHKP